jgi:DNA-binding response OmpR family regulator
MKPRPNRRLPTPAVSSPANPPRRHILLVDDDYGVRDALRSVLESEGYRVSCAADGFEAQKIAAREWPELVLLDLKLPGLSGWDTFERLTTSHPLTPIIVITARPGQLFTAAAAGVGALLEKPVDIGHLLELVRDLLNEPEENRLTRLTGLETRLAYVPASHPDR